MIKFGQVTAYNEKDHRATVLYVRPDACAKCGGCGSLNRKSTIDLKADCKVGDWVRVILPDNNFLSAAALAYLMPLFGFLLGLILGWELSGKNELWALGGAGLGILICAAALRVVEKAIAGNPKWTPCIDKVYETKPGIEDLGCGGEL